jgi:hypothetical protein
MANIGYARVSAQDQDFEAQVERAEGYRLQPCLCGEGERQVNQWPPRARLTPRQSSGFLCWTGRLVAAPQQPLRA